MCRPVLETEGSITMALAVNVDFENVEPTSSPTFTAPSGSVWNTSPWNTSPWNTSADVLKEWQGVDGVGYHAALHVKAAQKDMTLSWYSTDWIYESGGFL